MVKNDVEREEMKEESKQIPGRKRPREIAGSQTDDDYPSCSCLNMAATIGEINQMLDLALSRLQEIDDLKVTESKRSTERKHRFKRRSPLCAQTEMAELKEISKFHEGVIEALEIGVNAGFAERYQNGEGTCYHVFSRRPQPKDQFEFFPASPK